MADALDSGSSGGNTVRVQVPFSASSKVLDFQGLFYFLSFRFSPNSIGLRQHLRQRAFLYAFSLIIPYHLCLLNTKRDRHLYLSPICNSNILFLYNSKQYTNELSLFIQYPDNSNSISFNSVEYIIFSAEQKPISFPGFYCF